MAPFVGVFEIGCGVLILLGLLTRLAAIPMIVNMTVAVLSTKIPILLGHGYWMFNLPKMNQYGFWSMAHEARVDFSMILGAVFLLIVGAGCLSVDAIISRRARAVGRLTEALRIKEGGSAAPWNSCRGDGDVPDFRGNAPIWLPASSAARRRRN